MSLVFSFNFQPTLTLPFIVVLPLLNSAILVRCDAFKALRLPNNQKLVVTFYPSSQMLVSDATRIRDADGSPMMNGHNSATSSLGGASKGAGDYGQKKTGA